MRKLPAKQEVKIEARVDDLALPPALSIYRQRRVRLEQSLPRHNLISVNVNWNSILLFSTIRSSSDLCPLEGVCMALSAR